MWKLPIINRLNISPDPALSIPGAARRCAATIGDAAGRTYKRAAHMGRYKMMRNCDTTPQNFSFSSGARRLAQLQSARHYVIRDGGINFVR